MNSRPGEWRRDVCKTVAKCDTHSSLASPPRCADRTCSLKPGAGGTASAVTCGERNGTFQLSSSPTNEDCWFCPKNALFEQFIYKHDHFAKTASATNVRKVEKLSAPPLPQPPLCLSPIPCHLQTPIPFSQVSCPDMIASVMCD